MSNKIPIVLVHGYGNFKIWNTAKEYFEKLNMFSVYIFKYNDTYKLNVSYNSKKLFKYLITKNLVYKNTVFIGHSLGGLVIRKMLQDFNFVNFYKIVLLSTPNFGLSNIFLKLCYFSLICNGSITDMYKNSKFIRNLNENTINSYNEENLLTCHITNDEIVPIKSSLILVGSIYIVDSQTKSPSCIDKIQNLYNLGMKNGREKGEIHASIVDHLDLWEHVLRFILRNSVLF